MVKVSGVTKQYGGKKVVDNVSLEIAKGKITSFIGPNGAGKSTLMSMISRLIAKDAGEIQIEGREIGQWKSGELAKKFRYSSSPITSTFGLRCEISSISGGSRIRRDA